MTRPVRGWTIAWSRGTFFDHVSRRGEAMSRTASMRAAAGAAGGPKLKRRPAEAAIA
jgi:hypothetical protein